MYPCVTADDMLHAAYLTIGKLAPDYENVELSVGGSTVAAAVVEATGHALAPCHFSHCRTALCPALPRPGSVHFHPWSLRFGLCRTC